MVFNRKNCIKFLVLIFLCGIFYGSANAQGYKVPANQTVQVRNVSSAQSTASTQTSTRITNRNSFAYGWNEAQETDAVNRIGKALLAQSKIPSSRQVAFYVVQKDEVNAYTDQNNNVVVYKGILSYLEKEDELAFIIAHELGHVEQYHVVRGIFRNGLMSILTSFIGTATKTGNLSGVAGNMANKKFSRNDEFKADQRGIDFLVNTGYNPLASISVLYKIGTNYTDLWADHPSTDKRITKDYAYIQKNYPQFIEKGFQSSSYQPALVQIKKLSKNKAEDI